MILQAASLQCDCSKTIPPFQFRFFFILGEEPESEEEEAIVTGYATTLKFKLPD